MADFRAELAALVAAYDIHRKWTINAVFERLRQAVEHARDVLAQPEPAPAADEEVAELVTWLRREACFDSQWAASAWAPRLNRAADLLERQALRPIPVSERPWERQGWCNKDGRCWFGWADEPDASWSFCKPSERDTATVSLAAHALPLPEVE